MRNEAGRLLGPPATSLTYHDRRPEARTYCQLTAPSHLRGRLEWKGLMTIGAAVCVYENQGAENRDIRSSPKESRIMKCRIAGWSVDRLMQILTEERHRVRALFSRYSNMFPITNFSALENGDSGREAGCHLPPRSPCRQSGHETGSPPGSLRPAVRAISVCWNSRGEEHLCAL
jgi:hypothetical protein